MMHESMLFVLLLAATSGVVFCRTLTRSLLCLSLFSMILAAAYVLFNAPDVALTEAALGTVLTSLIFLSAIRKTEKQDTGDIRHD